MKEETTMVQTFVSEKFGEVRTVIINGEPYFVGKDVATALGYTNPRDALFKHVEPEDKMNVNLNTVAIRDGITGNPNVTVINESGLYSLVLTSTLPKAKEFKHWVTSEVLPSIRKTGEYKTTNKTSNNPDYKKIDSLIKIAGKTHDKKFREKLLQQAASLLGTGIEPPAMHYNSSKFSTKQIETIIAEHFDAGLSINALAKKYGVNYMDIYRIVKY